MLGLRRASAPRDRARRRRRRSAPRGRCRSRRRWSRSPRSSWSGPVKWVEDRRENFLVGAAGPRACARRSSSRWTPTAGSSALRGRILADLGAYLLPSTAIPPHTTAMLLSGCYDIPAVEVIVTGARTNKVPTAPYRGAGRPEATLPDRDGDRRRRPRARDRSASSCAAATSCARSRTGPRSAGRTTPATSSAAWTARSSCSRAPRRPRASRAGTWAARPDARRLARGRAPRSAPASRCASSAPAASTSTRGQPRRTSDVSSTSARPRPARATRRCSRRSPPTSSASTRQRVTVAHGDTDAVADGVGSFASRSDRDGRLGGRRGVRRPARPAARARALRVRPGVRLRRLRRGRRGRARPTGHRAGARGSSPSTTPGGSSTRCWPRAR